MDFYRIRVRDPKTKDDLPTLYPDFVIGRSKDLMVRGRSFYAIYDPETSLWSTDEYDVQRLIDADLEREARSSDVDYNVMYLSSFSSNVWKQFRLFLANVSDNSRQLDEELTFANTEVKKSDYRSRRLPYSLDHGDYSAWDELVGTLYSVEERAKIEWAIGAIVAGDAKRIQKFLVLYGPAGTGKSTILNIIEKLFTGYTTTFEAKALGSSNGSFATEVFKDNPLVAIQHDGDLSRIEDNTRLNSIISHEEMTMNEKYKPSYTSRVNAFLFMGTNQPVKISDAKSGIIRRLIDVHPTGVKIPANHYNALMSKIDFELGAIAQHCLDVYLEMGKNYYNTYRPLEMIFSSHRTRRHFVRPTSSTKSSATTPASTRSYLSTKSEKSFGTTSTSSRSVLRWMAALCVAYIWDSVLPSSRNQTPGRNLAHTHSSWRRPSLFWMIFWVTCPLSLERLMALPVRCGHASRPHYRTLTPASCITSRSPRTIS